MNLWGEIGLDASQHGERNGDHNESCLDRPLVASACLLPDNARARTEPMQRTDFGTIGNRTAQPATKRLADAPHATNRLQHRSGLVPVLAKIGLIAPKPGIENC